MQTSLEKLQSQKFLFVSLLSVGGIIFFVNLVDEQTRIIVTNLIYVPIPGASMILAIIIAIRFQVKGDHGKAWLLFACSTVSWFVAEQIWMLDEVFYKIDPYPSNADFFYIVGYPFLFAFSLFYLNPLRKAISKKLVIVASIVSITLLLPTFYIAYESSTGTDTLEFLLAVAYPILDAIILCPALIGLRLFFKGEVNFLWSLMCIAILMEVISDTGFLLLSVNDFAYYTGHPIDMLYLWSYILFSFGIYDHIRIFKSHKKDPYENINELR